jgi:hypothetical protein
MNPFYNANSLPPAISKSYSKLCEYNVRADIRAFQPFEVRVGLVDLVFLAA